MAITVRIAADPFDPHASVQVLAQNDPNVGALVSFIGLCRDEDGRLSGLELEHYPDMAEAEIGRIAQEAAERFGLSGVLVVHRYGLVRPGEPIVLVATAARHRGAAFAAAEFVMDYLKTKAPFWKREHRADGTVGDWVDATGADEEAARRW